MDVELLRSTWKTVQGLGDAVPLRFYSTLFWEHPETRAMFPPGMDRAPGGGPGQRDKLVYALGQAVAQVDRLEELKPILRRLGADHRRFGITPVMYDWVGSALLQTLADFFGENLTEDIATTWATAYAVLAEEMKAGAEEQKAAGIPPWWDAPLGAVGRHRDDVVLTIADHAEPPPGYDWMSTVFVRPPLRAGLWHQADATAQFGGRLTIIVPVDHSQGLDEAALALARLRPTDAVRIGAPWGSAPHHDHEETAHDA
jgi:hemoglobin-like flavoprotein